MPDRRLVRPQLRVRGGVPRQSPRIGGRSGARSDAPAGGGGVPSPTDPGATIIFAETWNSYSLNTANLLNGAGDHTYGQRGIALIGLSSSGPLPPGQSAKLTINYTGSGEVEGILTGVDVSSGAADVVCHSLSYRVIGNAYHGKMSIFNQNLAPGRRLLMHVAPRKPYPGGEEGASSGNNIVQCFWSDGDPFTPLDSDTPGGYEIFPVWNNDDNTLPGGIGYSYRPTKGKLTLGAYQSYVSTQSAANNFVTVTTRFTRGAGGTYSRSRIEVWVDAVAITEYLGDSGACPDGKVYAAPSATSITQQLDIGGVANAEWGGGGTVERGPEYVWKY